MMKRLSNAALGAIVIGVGLLSYYFFRPSHSEPEKITAQPRYQGTFKDINTTCTNFENYRMIYQEDVKGHELMTLEDTTGKKSLTKIVITDGSDEKISLSGTYYSGRSKIEQVELFFKGKETMIVNEKYTEKKTHSVEEETERLVADSLWKQAHYLYDTGRIQVFNVEKDLALNAANRFIEELNDTKDSAQVMGPPYIPLCEDSSALTQEPIEEEPLQ
jgi:hypothetical protein